jgi:hypothetical protein
MRYRNLDKKKFTMRMRICTRGNESFKGTKYAKICADCDRSKKRR